MCELLGLSFNKDVTVHLAFSGLKVGATDNPDGWGVAWYDEYGTQLIKEARPVDRSRLATSFLEDLGARSRTFVSHIRRATSGSSGYINTHPFYRRFGHKTWVFAHNGTIEKEKLEKADQPFIPIGETDSELVFCHILSWIQKNGIDLSDERNYPLLHEKLKEINTLGQLNLIFSDGSRLFAYHDIGGYVGLYYLLRQAPYAIIKLRGAYVTMNLAEVVDPDEQGYLVASEPLSDEKWVKIHPGQLLVFSGGDNIFISEHD